MHLDCPTSPNNEASSALGGVCESRQLQSYTTTPDTSRRTFQNYPPRGILRNSGTSLQRSPHVAPLAREDRRKSVHDGPISSSACFPQRNPRSRLALPSRVTDAEADRLARACGDGPFSPTCPTPFLETSAFTNAPPVERARSQSLSSPQTRRQSADPHSRSRSVPVKRIQHFPRPPAGHTLRALKRILNEETKTFKIHDYIEVEDLISGKLWDDEDELPVDCVRDKADDDSGHDGVWRRERRTRLRIEGAQRAIHQRDGSMSLISQARGICLHNDML